VRELTPRSCSQLPGRVHHQVPCLPQLPRSPLLAALTHSPRLWPRHSQEWEAQTSAGSLRASFPRLPLERPAPAVEAAPLACLAAHYHSAVAQAEAAALAVAASPVRGCSGVRHGANVAMVRAGGVQKSWG